MAQRIVDLTNRKTEILKTISQLEEEIFELENEVKILNEERKDLERQLENEKKRRSGDSDSSNSPPLNEKWYISN